MANEGKERRTSSSRLPTSVPPETLTEPPRTGRRTTDVDVMSRFFAVQDREARLHALEVENAAKTAENAHVYALEALKSQSADLREQRAHSEKQTKHWLAAMAVVAIVFTTIAVVAIFRNQGPQIYPMLYALLCFGAGVAAGWGVRATRDGKTRTIS